MIGEWTGLICGPIGTYILTLQVKHHKFGWVLMIGAALSWLSVGIETNMPGLYLVQTGYLILAILGFWNTRGE
jgi:hypothetical protein